MTAAITWPGDVDLYTYIRLKSQLLEYSIWKSKSLKTFCFFLKHVNQTERIY